MANRRCINHEIDRLLDQGRVLEAYGLAGRYSKYEQHMPAVTRAGLVFRWNLQCNALMTGYFVGYMNDSHKEFCDGEDNPASCRNYYDFILDHYWERMTRRFPCTGQGSELQTFYEMGSR